MYFYREERAKYYDCDNRNLLRISAAMRYMQQTSSEHLDALGYSVEKLYHENMVFLLSKMNIQVHRMPECSERLRVGTAATQPKGARFIREFVIETPEGERLLSALSYWILVDPASRKIYRPASFPYPFHFEEVGLSNEVSDVRFPKTGEAPAYKIDIPVRYSHLDINQHVNNTIYADFVCDALPFEQIGTRGVSALSIAFQNEARHGEVLQVNACAVDSHTYHIKGLHNGGACFEALAEIADNS